MQVELELLLICSINCKGFTTEPRGDSANQVTLNGWRWVCLVVVVCLCFIQIEIVYKLLFELRDTVCCSMGATHLARFFCVQEYNERWLGTELE